MLSNSPSPNPTLSTLSENAPHFPKEGWISLGVVFSLFLFGFLTYRIVKLIRNRGHKLPEFRTEIEKRESFKKDADAKAAELEAIGVGKLVTRWSFDDIEDHEDHPIGDFHMKPMEGRPHGGALTQLPQPRGTNI